MKKGSEYKITFTGLKDEIHHFNYKIGKPFFELLDYSDISDADLEVKLTLDKRETMMVAEFDISGTVVTTCDRCTDDMELYIATVDELIYKFGEADLDDEKIVMIHPNDISINIQHPIYEFAALQLPSKRVHPEGECNLEMLNALDQYLMVESDSASDNRSDEDDEEDVDPRWNELKKLK
ncbi:MAG: DUF177 domain-containing protein [Crocinitomicaceae bacterium]|nr:DUF177 domain-containing protein [Crocinitomicaceae bacterium]